MAFTGNNMKKQNPAQDKKEKDVSGWTVTVFSTLFLWPTKLAVFPFVLVLSHEAVRGGFEPCVLSLHKGEPAAVADEAGKAQNF